MTDLDKYLIPSETPVVLTRRHWASLLKIGSMSGLALLIGVLLLTYAADSQGLAIFAVVVMLAALCWFGWSWWSWYTEEFVITDRRVLLIDGILTRRVAIMPLSKVTDLTYERSIFGRILGYGVFVMESAGQQQALNRIDYLPTPDKLYHDVSTLLFGVESGFGYRRASRRDGDNPTTPLPPTR
ncbi:MAG: PH domain-containing protein [Actinomycetota bacterium]|nr:PH domain-containing protein [Actinomycetota bacterium]MDQ2956821.1 PH domain-containing protein [Actinomycetota bacterium]